MNELNLKIDSSTFNLIWRSLYARENELLKIVKENGDDSNEGADALNDLAVLRIYREELKEQAETVFDEDSFIIEDIPLDIGALHIVT